MFRCSLTILQPCFHRHTFPGSRIQPRRRSCPCSCLNVLDNEVGGIKTPGLGVGLGVLQEAQNILSGLDGPSSTGNTKLLAYPNRHPLAIVHGSVPILNSAVFPKTQWYRSSPLIHLHPDDSAGSRTIFVPWEHRPMLPAYRRKGTASFFSTTWFRKAVARPTFHPLMVLAVSRVFLKETRRYEPLEREDFSLEMAVAAYRTYVDNMSEPVPFILGLHISCIRFENAR